jgi:MFS family permease
VPRLVHDRVTWLIYAQLGTWGFFLYGFGPVVPLLRDEQGTTTAVASLHSTALAAGGLLGAASFPWLVQRFGRGHILWAGLGGVVVSVLMLCTFRPFPATLTAAVLVSAFGTWLVCAVNTALSEHHGPVAAAAISEANAVAAGVGILAPIVVGLTVAAGLTWRPGLAVVVVLIALVALASLIFRVRLPAGPALSGGPSGRAPLPRAYWIAWTLMAATASIEVCLSLWAADVLRTHAGMSPGAASAAVASIVAGMFAGRLIGGRIALRIAPAPLLLGALAVSLAGFAVFWTSPVGWLAAAGLVVVGLGNALHYPLGVSMALATAGDQPDRGAAYSSYSVAVGFGVAPLVLGWVADGIGPHLAFLLLPAFIGVAALLVTRLRLLPATG